MSLFTDRLLLQLGDPAQLAELLAPAADPSRARLRVLLAAVYDFPFASIHDVQEIQVRRREIERPIFPLTHTSGTWTRSTPSYTRTDVAYQALNGAEPTWLDIAAEVGMTLVLDVDAGQVASILTREITGFDTLAEFRARFRFIDLDAFMGRHGITTVEELKEAYHYLLTEVQLQAPGPFDPTSPANRHRFTLSVAVQIRESIDVAAALRAAKLARAVAERTVPYYRETGGAEVRTPYAPLVIFPEGALTGLPFTGEALRAFFATEGILALFLTPA
jgi:hypothetical protein